MRWFWRFSLFIDLEKCVMRRRGKTLHYSCKFKWIEGCDINSLNEYFGSDRAMRSGKAAE